MHLHANKIYGRLLTKGEGPFVDLFFMVDNLMKELIAKGKGVVVSASPITNAMEEEMLQTGILGEHNPKQLCETLLFLIGINFALRGGEEHKTLHRPSFNPQIVVSTDTESIKCLKYTADVKNKTNQGGLINKYHAPKVVHVYENDNRQRCLVRLYEKYIGLLPSSQKHQELYMYGKKTPMPNCWYDDRCLGINAVRQIVKRLCNLAGFEGGVFRNHSLKASTCSHMFSANQDEQIIKKISGHASNAVHTYKHVK